jgi:ABC-type transporter Mla MlaB component
MLNEEDLQMTTAENDMNPIADVPEDHDLEPDAMPDVAESVIILDTTLTIQNVFKLYEKLKKSYTVHDSIEINASQVSTIDTATLQLLAALKKEAVKEQKSVVMTEPSQRFIESAGLLGLLELLEIEAFV